MSRLLVLTTVAMAIVGLQAGCKGGATRPPQTGVSGRTVEELAADLTLPDPGKQIVAADELAKRPPGDLKKVLPTLKKALKAKPGPQLRRKLQELITKAQGAG